MVDNRSLGWRLFNPPEQVHQDTLTGPAPADDTDNLAFRDLKRDLI